MANKTIKVVEKNKTLYDTLMSTAKGNKRLQKTGTKDDAFFFFFFFFEMLYRKRGGRKRRKTTRTENFFPVPCLFQKRTPARVPRQFSFLKAYAASPPSLFVRKSLWCSSLRFFGWQVVFFSSLFLFLFSKLLPRPLSLLSLSPSSPSLSRSSFFRSPLLPLSLDRKIKKSGKRGGNKRIKC